ncbi:MAG TPA: hypothetical protein VN278_03480 [Methanosarcina sp.]|nr:hypothetical protein [Methanosarcina sp.]
MNNEQFRKGKYIRLDSVEIAFNKTDAEININYHLSPFAQVYMFLFGSKNLEPKIREIFFDFENVQIQKVERTSASVLIRNLSRQSGGYYLHESRELGMRPDTLIIVYPDGTRRNLQRTKFTQPAFYPVLYT